MRNGLAFHVLGDIGNLEIDHPFAHHVGELHQSVNIMFSVNPAAFVFMVSRLAK